MDDDTLKQFVRRGRYPDPAGHRSEASRQLVLAVTVALIIFLLLLSTMPLARPLQAPRAVPTAQVQQRPEAP